MPVTRRASRIALDNVTNTSKHLRSEEVENSEPITSKEAFDNDDELNNNNSRQRTPKIKEKYVRRSRRFSEQRKPLDLNFQTRSLPAKRRRHSTLSQDSQSSSQPRSPASLLDHFSLPNDESFPSVYDSVTSSPPSSKKRKETQFLKTALFVEEQKKLFDDVDAFELEEEEGESEKDSSQSDHAVDI